MTEDLQTLQLFCGLLSAALVCLWRRPGVSTLWLHFEPPSLSLHFRPSTSWLHHSPSGSSRLPHPSSFALVNQKKISGPWPASQSSDTLASPQPLVPVAPSWSPGPPVLPCLLGSTWVSSSASVICPPGFSCPLHQGSSYGPSACFWGPTFLGSLPGSSCCCLLPVPPLSWVAPYPSPSVGLLLMF